MGAERVSNPWSSTIFHFFETLPIFFLCKGANTKKGKLIKDRALPIKSRILFLFTLLWAAVVSSQMVHANPITVVNTSDQGIGSLRWALAVAQSGDTIVFDVTGTIGLTSGPLNVPDFKNISISGPEANALAINGNETSFIFSIGRSDVSISNLTITNGSNDDSEGGAIRVLPGSKLTLSNCIISNNSTSVDGGAIFVGSTDSCGGLQTNLILNYCTVSGNSASAFGGAIASEACAQTMVTINSCTISGNEAGLAGGGLYNDAGTRRGRVRLTIKNSTISGNSADNAGGAIENDGAELIVSYCTISDNSALLGDSISNDDLGAIVTIVNSILNASSGQNISGRIRSLGHNLSSDDGSGFLTNTGDQINTDPLLSPLQNNGGPTLTHALLPGSPAIDHGNPIFRPPPDEDQRGCPFDRVFNNRIDVGSFENQPTRPPCLTPRPRPTPGPR